MKRQHEHGQTHEPFHLLCGEVSHHIVPHQRNHLEIIANECCGGKQEENVARFFASLQVFALMDFWAMQTELLLGTAVGDCFSSRAHGRTLTSNVSHVPEQQFVLGFGLTQIAISKVKHFVHSDVEVAYLEFRVQGHNLRIH